MADDFEMKMLSLMSAYGLPQERDENTFYFNNLSTTAKCSKLHAEIQAAVSLYKRKVQITRYAKQITLNDLGGMK